jgi:hypothetical protein
MDSRRAPSSLKTPIHACARAQTFPDLCAGVKGMKRQDAESGDGANAYDVFFIKRMANGGYDFRARNQLLRLEVYGLL